VLLARLTRGQMGDLIRKAAHERDLPDAWVAEIVRRADGVPLFAEELTRAAVESDPDLAQAGATPELHIPETLQDSLMARLDALGPVKELAQLGAVLGREFSYALLLEVSPLKETQLREALAEAVREELFYQRGAPPEATYLFKHALIRDAAYQSLLRATRRRHHQRVADTMIDRMPEVAEAQPELVAYHLTEAGEGEAAIAYWQRAGERANARAANEEAIRHLRRGLALLDELAPGVKRDGIELGLQVPLARALAAARGLAHADTQQAWDRARALCDPAMDPLRAAAIHWGLGSCFNSRGDPRKGFEMSTQLLRIAEQDRNELFVIAGESMGGTALLFLGEFGASCERLERAIGLYDPARHRFFESGLQADAGINALAFGSWAFWHRGFPDRSRKLAEQAVRLARPSPQLWDLALNVAYTSITALFRRDWAGAQKLAAEAVHIGESQGFPLAQSVGLMVETVAGSRGGGGPGALERYAAAMAIQAGTGNRGAAPLVLGELAGLQVAADHVEQAAGTVEGALEIARETGQAFRDAELHRMKGEIFLKLPDHSEDEAEALFREAIGIARGQEAKSLELRAAMSLARLWQRQGRCDEARDLVAPIYDWFTEGFDTRDLKDAKALLEELA
jgi:tetratricopeptide (TPR) repeat protein